MKKLQKNRRKGAALVEYGLLIAGVALVSAAAVSIFGHKTNDLIAATASILPGAHDDDNGPILSGRLIETGEVGANDELGLDITAIVGNAGNERLGDNLLGTTSNTAGPLTGLVVEAN
ncbi:MAG: hypothetical protein KIT58_06455 [Planctomycetota bacterium]|nr:hypothetical protein [Planctomycetota bacterium]